MNSEVPKQYFIEHDVLSRPDEPRDHQCYRKQEAHSENARRWGQFTSTQLDGYLGDLETVYDVYDEGLLSEAELCGSFSVYVQEAEADSEVQDYLKENSHYFSGLPKLFDIVDHSKNENCRD